MANVITTQAPTNIGKFGFTFNGTLVSKDNALSEYGFCWMKGTGTPVYDANTQKVLSDLAVGAYIKNTTETTPMYGCMPGITYSVRAFGKDSVTEEIFYGDTVTFATLSSTFSGTITVEGAPYTGGYFTLGTGKDLTTWTQSYYAIVYGGSFETECVVLVYESIIDEDLSWIGDHVDVSSSVRLLGMRDHLLMNKFRLTGGKVENLTLTHLTELYHPTITSGKLNCCTVWSKGYDFNANDSTASLTNVTSVGAQQCDGTGSIAGVGLNKVTIQSTWNQGSLTDTPSPNDVQIGDSVSYDGFGLAGFWLVSMTEELGLPYGIDPVEGSSWNATTKVVTINSIPFDCSVSGEYTIDLGGGMQIVYGCDTTLLPTSDIVSFTYYVLKAPAGPTGYGRENGTAGALISATETPVPPVSSFKPQMIVVM
jgi:hypothetical protein